MKDDFNGIHGALYGWTPLGRALERGTSGTFDCMVTGDPCIVWDDANNRWLMYYFAAGNAIGTKGLDIGMAVSKSALEAGAGDWEKLGPAKFDNREDIWQQSPHKPWILMDSSRPNRAACPDGKYHMFFVSKIGLNCVIQHAEADFVYGPWTVKRQPVLCPDSVDGFDSYHTDTVTAYWFEKEAKILLFYKGYPQCEQHDQPETPFGSSTAAAVMRLGDEKAQKAGKIIGPDRDIAHWMSGWVGGLQLIPRTGGGWMGLINASPTPPDTLYNQLYMREPNPSLGGWAWTSESFPDSGWVSDTRPIKWINELSREESDFGERVNLFRHHLLVIGDNDYYLFYNSGPYNNEQMFVHRFKSANK